MAWNWQQDGWPNFRHVREEAARLEQDFRLSSGRWLGVFAHLNEQDRQGIQIELLGEEALDTSEIEGEYLDRNSVQSSIQRQLGLKSDQRRVRPAEEGIAELMVDTYRGFNEPLTQERLGRWHRMVMRGRTDLADLGRYRTGHDPMRIVSGPLHDPKIHFEAPPASRVGAEMDRFLEWFAAAVAELPSTVTASLAHLRFESIHPFEDGNGRIGRAIAVLAVSQSLAEPVLLPLSQAIARKRKRYYDELARASRSLDASAWIRYFSHTLSEAQELSLRQVHFALGKARLLDRLRGQLNERQERALLRVFAEGIDGFTGGLSSANYRSITKASPATATRDLTGLVELGALVSTGKGKGTRYWLPPEIAQDPPTSQPEQRS